MNNKAIDMGADELVKVEVPASWKNAKYTPVKFKGDTDFAETL